MIRAVLLLVVAVTACEAPFYFPPPIATVTVSPAAADLPQGDSLQLTAAVRDSAGVPVTSRPVLWTSSDPVHLPVSATGRVTAVGPATATIGATVDGVRGGASIRVIAKVAGVTIDQGDLALVPSGSVPLTTTLHDSEGRLIGGRAIAWTSADTQVARVSATGLLEATGVGITTVSATVDGVRAAIAIWIARVRFTSLNAGEFRHTCARASDGHVLCWGENGLGQLGVPALARSAAPIAAPGAPGFADVTSGGTFTCALTPAGQPYCWGSGARGRLGNGSLADTPVATAVPLGQTLIALASGWNHSCGVGAEGEGYCWGEFPQVGNGPGPIARTPVLVSGGRSYRQIAAGEGFSCGLGTDSLAYCWGMNFASRLGVDSVSASATPVPVQQALRFTGLAAGGLHACGLTPSGAAWCWGGNAAGQLGAGALLDSSAAPQPVAGGLVFAAVAAGTHSTCGITAAGQAYCWGANDAGQLGSASSESCSGTPCSRSPLPVSGGLTFTTISVGDSHACGLSVAGIAYCWGKNDRGQLGDGTLVDRSAPVQVVGQH